MSHMRIILVCQSCKALGGDPPRYEGTFTNTQNTVDIKMTFDCAVVPGTDYELCMKGIYPGYLDGRPCIGDMLSFSMSGTLDSIDVNERTLKKLDQQRGV